MNILKKLHSKYLISTVYIDEMLVLSNDKKSFVPKKVIKVSYLGLGAEKYQSIFTDIEEAIETAEAWMAQGDAEVDSDPSFTDEGKQELAEYVLALVQD